MLGSGDVAHDLRSECGRDARRQSLPEGWPPRDSFIGRRWGAGCAARGEWLVPPEELVPCTPLRFESVRTTAGGAPAEVEQLEAFIGHPLDEAPVEKHVGGNSLVLLQRGRPCHLKLVLPSEATAGSHRLAIQVSAPKEHVLGKQLRNRAKEGRWKRWCAEISHVT